MDEAKWSYQTGIKKQFHAADYVVFALTLLLSAAIGVFYAIKDRKKNSSEEYLLAGRDMHPFLVAMSLLSSFISAITILGTPAEVYVYSTMYWWISVAFIFTALMAANIFIPIFYNLGITSVFQVSCTTYIFYLVHIVGPLVARCCVLAGYIFLPLYRLT